MFFFVVVVIVVVERKKKFCNEQKCTGNLLGHLIGECGRGLVGKNVQLKKMKRKKQCKYCVGNTVTKVT
jgi:hypothetical protein